MAKKDSHFIPSPFPVVTDYENEFVREFNRNMAGAVAEVLKYIAKATASVAKESKGELKDDLFE